MASVVAPISSIPIVDSNGLLQLQFQLFLAELTDALNHRLLLIGTGSPEGVVDAEQGVEYMDDAGVAGAIKYIKRDNDIAGDTTKGWVLV